MKGDKKITLTEKELPTHWYNIVADMTNKPLPPLNPVTQQAASKEDFAYFCRRVSQSGIFARTFYRNS